MYICLDGNDCEKRTGFLVISIVLVGTWDFEPFFERNVFLLLDSRRCLPCMI